MSADNETPVAPPVVPSLTPRPAPRVECEFRGHTYSLPVLTRAVIDGQNLEPTAHDVPISCSQHGDFTPPVIMVWRAKEAVVIISCVACGNLVGAIRLGTEA